MFKFVQDSKTLWGFFILFFLFAIADSAYNLRQENKQLRKAHHDIHTQLQDAQVKQNKTKQTQKKKIKKIVCFVELLLMFCLHSVGSTPEPEGSARTACTDAGRPQECAGCSSGELQCF